MDTEKLFKKISRKITINIALWCSYKTTDYKRVIVAYNDVYRSLFGIKRGESISNIYVINGINSFNMLVRKYIFSFRDRLMKSENILIKTAVGSTFFNVSRMTCKWNQQLYL